MRCKRCGEEIALAKRCPYCGAARLREDDSSRDGQFDQFSEGPRGQFRGRVGAAPHHDHRLAPVTFAMLLRYLFDPEVPLRRKWVLYAAIFYVLSPVDFIPGAFFPVIGWLDDLAVMLWAWRWFRNEMGQPGTFH